jgi:hypothetical protein
MQVYTAFDLSDVVATRKVTIWKLLVPESG